MSVSNEEDLKSSEAFGKAELRASFTTLTYITDDVTSPEYVSPEFNESQDNPAFELEERDDVHSMQPAVVTPTSTTSTSLQADAKVSANGAHANGYRNGVNITGSEESVQHISSSNVNNSTEQADVEIIQTRTIQRPYDPSQTPLTRRKIQVLKGFSIAVAIFFFPTGIPAALYAFKIDKAFQDGIMQGNIDLALKLAKRTEKLVLLSAVLGVLFIVMCFAIIERVTNGNEYSWNKGTLVGH